MHISVLSTADPLVRSVATLSLSDLCPVLVVDLHENGTRLTFVEGFEESSVDVPLAHACLACSMREAIIPFLQTQERATGLDAVILALPPAVESATIVPRFVDDIEELNWEVSSSVHVCDLGSIAEDLLCHVSLADRNVALFDDDERCLGEVHLMNIGYSDIVVTIGTDAAALELVEHFRPIDSLLIPSLSEVGADIVFGGHHDVEAALRRIHPATAAAWGGPHDHGVWTLDLHSERAFHPDRFVEALRELCGGEVCVRGCFWLPTRPDLVCALNAHGGLITIGSAGEWPENPHTHLVVTGRDESVITGCDEPAVVTGCDESAVVERDKPECVDSDAVVVGMTSDRRTIIELAFVSCLLSPEEQQACGAWLGIDDGLDEWFD